MRSLFILTQVAPYVDGPAGVHHVLPQASAALAELGTMVGLRPQLRDVATLSPEDLSEGGVIALFTIGETPFSALQRQAFVETWESGRLGVMGLHSASDACHGRDRYVEMIGARFAGHPWTQDFEIDVVDPSHPSTEYLPRPWRWHDELYLFDELQPSTRVLLALAPDQLDMSVPGGRVPQCGFPLAWCIEDGPRRSFYSALGHFSGAWESPIYLRHLHGGRSWLCEG